MKRTWAVWLGLVLLHLVGCGGDETGAADSGAQHDSAWRLPDAASDAGFDARIVGVDAGRDSGPVLPTDAGTDSAVSIADGGHDAALPGDAAGVGHCNNGITDGDESDIDCGGQRCGVCLSGRHCALDADCLSGACNDGSCACQALTSCPALACGVVRHCGGELDCGACDEGVCYQNRCCQPRACRAGECGVISDGCGGTLRCGDESCCTPRTCEHASLADRCGAFDDRCGGTIQCSCGSDADTCFLGECCTPRTCGEDDACGTLISDGCGGVRSCDCADDQTCYQGACCTPLDCSSFAGPGCARISDGCGGMLDCGCAAGVPCVEGECCQPSACEDGSAGSTCGNAIPDGCGGTHGCACDNGLSCIDGACCASQTCSQLGLDHVCGGAVSCGSNLWCGCGSSHGVLVSQRNACGNTCEDTLGEVSSCTAGPALETVTLTAGWDLPWSLSGNICNASFGFDPPFTQCHGGNAGFHLDARGFISLGAGTHCFSITGNGFGSCGALYLVTDASAFTGWSNLSSATAALTTTGGGVDCVSVTASGNYPIRWAYSQTGGLTDFHVNYCTSNQAGSCSPIPLAMLYPELP